MYQDTYFVSKRTGTYTDVLLTFGLATILDRLAGLAKGEFEKPHLEIADVGPYYQIHLEEPVQDNWIPDDLYFRNPAWFLTNQQTRPGDVPPDTTTRNVDTTWDQVRAYHDVRSSLWENGIRGSDLEQQLRDKEPPGDWAIVAFLGDQRMHAKGIYNRVVGQWAESRRLTAVHIRAILQLFASLQSDEDTILNTWEETVQAHDVSMRARETASQLLNPHQGKGLNEPKANALRMNNVRDRPWLIEMLKAVGLWSCLVPRRVVDVGDWKAYVPAPLRLGWRVNREIMARFNRYLWHERRNDATSLKADVTSLLLFTRAWLDHVEAADEDNVDFDADLVTTAPEKIVAGFHVAQFKRLSQRAYSLVSLSFLSLPHWMGAPATRADVMAVREVINEHLEVVRNIEEERSDGYDLLRAYRDFVTGNKWDAFFEFTVGYGHSMMRRLNEGAPWVPTLSPSGLRRLIVSSNQDILPIVESKGFQMVAYAIRHSTIVPQGRKARGLDALYNVRYGLGAALKGKAPVLDEFIVVLCDFMQSYNQENVQKLESKEQQMRRDLCTTDIEEVVRLVDAHGSEVVGNLLVAYGYACEPRESQSKSVQ